MNYLEICKRVNDVVGFQGNVTSVLATGYQSTLTTSVKDAYEDIQRYRPDWQWMKAYKSVTVSGLQTEYTLEDLWAGDTPDLAEYQYVNFEYRRLIHSSYDAFILFDFTVGSYSEPNTYTIAPATKNLLISPVDANYSLEIHYIRTLDELTVNTSVPILPARFHQLIVYGAIVKLSTFVGNGTLFDTYSHKYDVAMGQLMREENPAKKIIKRPIA